MAVIPSYPVDPAPNQGVMEKRDPVPAGRYWVYIDQSEVARWQAWVSASGGNVKVVATEEQRVVSKWLPIVFVTRFDLSIIQSVVGYWILFDVLAPTKWVGFGYPTTVIDPKVKSSTDIATAPAPVAEENPIVDFLGSIKNLVLVGVGVFVAVQVFDVTKTVRSLRAGMGR